MPEDFGLIALVMVFFELSASFVDSGFSNALVREKEITKEDKSTTFVFNFFISIAAYIILFFAAPAIAAFFEQPELVLLTRVLGINLIINACAIIQKAVLTQQVDFNFWRSGYWYGSQWIWYLEFARTNDTACFNRCHTIVVLPSVEIEFEFLQRILLTTIFLWLQHFTCGLGTAFFSTCI